MWLRREGEEESTRRAGKNMEQEGEQRGPASFLLQIQLFTLMMRTWRRSGVRHKYSEDTDSKRQTETHERHQKIPETPKKP